MGLGRKGRKGRECGERVIGAWWEWCVGFVGEMERVNAVDEVDVDEDGANGARRGDGMERFEAGSRGEWVGWLCLLADDQGGEGEFKCGGEQEWLKYIG